MRRRVERGKKPGQSCRSAQFIGSGDQSNKRGGVIIGRSKQWVEMMRERALRVSLVLQCLHVVFTLSVHCDNVTMSLRCLYNVSSLCFYNVFTLSVQCHNIAMHLR